MRAVFKRLHETLGNTIIYVTHDRLEAMTMISSTETTRGWNYSEMNDIPEQGSGVSFVL